MRTDAFTHNFMRFFNRTIALYCVWILLHFGATHLYPRVCAPMTVAGLFMSPFMTAAPHCVAMRWAMLQGATSINCMWMMMGSIAFGVLVEK
jgi:hypothetical protein